jgi:hypothetical protein
MSGRCLNGAVSAVSAMLGAMASMTDFGGEAFDKQAYSSLGRAIDGKTRLDRHRAHRRASDEAAAALIDHHPAEGLKEINRTFDIERDDPLDIFLGVLENRLADIEAGGGDGDIEP